MQRGLVLLLVGPLLLPSAAAETVRRRGLRAEVAALLMQGVAGGGLPIAAAVFPRPAAGAGESVELGFLLELPAAPPEETAGGRPLEVYAYAVDAADEVVAHFAVTVPDWPARSEGLKVAGRLEAAPGDLSLRFLAWDPMRGNYGMAVRRLTLDASSTSPRIVEACAGWSAVGSEAADLLNLSARPVLVRGQTRRLSLGGRPPSAGWRVRLVGQGDGAPTEEVAASTAATGELEFEVPELPPGAYQLSVGAEKDGDWRSSALEIWLVRTLPPVGDGCRGSWTRVLRLSRSAGLGALPESLPPGKRRPGSRLAAGYEGVLGRLAAVGDLASAAARLAVLEGSIAGAEPSRMGMLFSAELETARSLADRDPRSLLPLVALHAETYREHYGAGRFSLATHSRRLAATIADLAVELLAAPEERSLLAVAITGLADMVETRRASIEAQRLLERALALDDSQEATRLLLAVSYERKGRFEDARRQLEALVSANSAHYEARVRLAILLRRLGERQEAERLLRAVVSERPPTWLLSLAYQTLGQLLIRETRLAEAVALLAQAGERLPGDQAVVRQALADLPLVAAGVTPRFRYSDEPPVALGLMRETLRQSVTVRLPVLALVVGAEHSGGPFL